MLISTSLHQYIRDAEARKKSSSSPNAGKTKTHFIDQIFLFLTISRRGLPFAVASVLFELHSTTIKKLFHSTRERLSKSFVPYLFSPSSFSILYGARPKRSAFAFPNALYIVDGLPLPMAQPEITTLNRLSFSSYKNSTKFQAVVGTYITLNRFQVHFNYDNVSQNITHSHRGRWNVSVSLRSLWRDVGGGYMHAQ